jgi:hypothetical protein
VKTSLKRQKDVSIEYDYNISASEIIYHVVFREPAKVEHNLGEESF